MIQTTGQGENVIVNSSFMQRLWKDIKKYDILYIYAPLGWRKYALMSELYANYDSAGKTKVWLEAANLSGLQQQLEQLPKNGHRLYMIPQLERMMEKGQQELIWQLLSEKKKGDVFLIASSSALPEKLLPYTIMHQCITYGINDLRPTNEDVAAYMKSKDVLLTQEELLRIERDSNNLPLFLQMLVNLLRGSGKEYSRAVRERCFEDVFTYIDVVFFRTFTEEDQDTLLKISCFEEFDYRLLSYILDIPKGEAKAFIVRLLNKSSVIAKSREGWKFQTLMKQFLERAIYKYLGREERQAVYWKAMHYLMECKQWFAALRFAYILREQEPMAVCLDHFLSREVDYDALVSSEEYFQELTRDSLKKHPKLMASGFILAAVSGDMAAAQRYEQMFRQYIGQTEDEEIQRELNGWLVYMYMACPSSTNVEYMEPFRAMLTSVADCFWIEESKPLGPNYISFLRGEKDYCRYFIKGTKESEAVSCLYEMADILVDYGCSTMLKFIEAEVCYEQNELDTALDKLSDVIREVKLTGTQGMYQLCMIAMVDLLTAKNQLNSQEVFQLEGLEEESFRGTLFEKNCQAHRVWYSLLKNHKDSILSWLKTRSPDENGRFYTFHYYQYLIKAKVYIWMEQYVRARMVLQTLFVFAQECDMTYLEMQVRILKAVVYFREGSGLWKETLLPALECGKSANFIRVFADEGAAVYELLKRIEQEEKAWASDEYFKKVLTASRAQMLQYPQYLRQEKQGEIGNFSASERDVMRLLVLGERNADIAARLCVSENTVKYHLKNIYVKLEVKNRSQAIHKIREYELL